MKAKITIEYDVNAFLVGDIIKVDLTDGEKAQAMAVHQDNDGMIFCLVDCLKDELPMNSRATNEGKYEACELRKTLNNEILGRFPAKLKALMIPFDNGDLLRLPTEKEIFGENSYGEQESKNVHQWEPMKLRRNRMAFQGDNGAAEWYWLQNAAVASTTYFCGCHGNGYAYYTLASYSFGVRPAFKIKNL